MTEQKSFADKYKRSDADGSGSMAERYKKSSGSNFTGESLEKKKPAASQAAAIDPQKKSKADFVQKQVQEKKINLGKCMQQ